MCQNNTKKANYKLKIVTKILIVNKKNKFLMKFQAKWPFFSKILCMKFENSVKIKNKYVWHKNC